MEVMLCSEAPFVWVTEPGREVDGACGSLETWVFAELVKGTGLV